MPELRFPRRSALTALLAVPLTAASACSRQDKPGAQPSTSSSTTSTTTTTTTTTTRPAPPKPVVTGKGLPADLLQTMTALYLGGRFSANADQHAVLARRKVGKASVVVSGRMGTWKKVPIAVVVRGKDVTLLTKGKAWTVVGGWWPSLGVARAPMKTMRILAIGSDARAHQRVEACRADALQIIGVTTKGVGGIVGIPRDSWVTLSTGGASKINSALTAGGARAQVQTVQRATNVRIDGYVMTGFAGFRSLVASLGGITFVAGAALRSVDGYQIVKAGTNRLNSRTALALARERKNLSNGDFGRSANQGLMIRAGIAMAQAAGPLTLPRYLTSLGNWVTTDLTVTEVLNLSASLYLRSASAIPRRVAPGAVGTRSGQSVVLLGGGARSVFAEIRDGWIG